MMVLGVVLIMKTEWFVNNFGSNAWAEAKLGTSGGTRLMYKLSGLLIIFFGLLVVTNMMGGFVMGTVGKFFIK